MFILMDNGVVSFQTFELTNFSDKASATTLLRLSIAMNTQPPAFKNSANNFIKYIEAKYSCYFNLNLFSITTTTIQLSGRE